MTRAVALTRTMGEMALNFWVATMVEMKACRPRVKREWSRASRRENCGLSAKSSTTIRTLNMRRSFFSFAAAMISRCVSMISWSAPGS
jgi:hypothetical protein